MERIVFLRPHQEDRTFLHLQGSIDTINQPEATLFTILLSIGDEVKCDIPPQSSSVRAPHQGEGLESRMSDSVGNCKL